MAPALKVVALAVVVCALYGAHVWMSPFVYEDHRIMQGTDGDPVTLASVSTGRGLTAASWAIVRTPQAAHALNVVLHLAVIGLVALIAGRLLDPWQAIALTGIVALHPLTVETVAYAVSRAELIAAVGVLLSLLCVTARSAWAWMLVPPCLLLAYFGKETGIVAIGLIPLVLWAKGDPVLAEALAWAVGGAGAVIVALGGSAMLAMGEAPHLVIAPLSWVLIQGEAVYRLVILSVWPAWLSVSPSISGAAGVAALILLAGLLEAAWRARRTAPLFAFGIAWCAIVAAPRFLVRTPASPFNEHQWYLAMPGVACVLVAGLALLAAMLTARLPVWRVA